GNSLRTIDLISLRRHTGYVIQGSGLFPHRTVYENITTVPRLLGWSESEARTAAGEMMEKLELPLGRFGDRYPRSLSGGEQGRVVMDCPASEFTSQPLPLVQRFVDAASL